MPEDFKLNENTQIELKSYYLNEYALVISLRITENNQLHGT